MLGLLASCRCWIRNKASFAGAAILATLLFTPALYGQQSTKSADQRAAAPEPRKVDISRFHVPGHGSVNTWLVEGPSGLVIIDFQRDVESARAAIAQIRTKGKPVRALLLTHSHPDHMGGIEAFKAAFPGVPLHASKATVDEVRNDTRAFQKLAREQLKDKAPAAYPVPDRVLKDRDRLRVAGLVIETREWGPGESMSATMYYLPQTGDLFSGDVVSNRATGFLLEGRAGLWLTQLRVLSAAYPGAKVTHPGHGDSGSAKELIKLSRDYLDAFRTAVRAEMRTDAWNGRELSEAGSKRVAAAIERQFPNQPRVADFTPNMLELNAAAVALELASEKR